MKAFLLRLGCKLGIHRIDGTQTPHRCVVCKRIPRRDHFDGTVYMSDW